MTRPQQRISANGGVAYGVVDAELYRHGTPKPVLLLADLPLWPCPPDPGPGLDALLTWLGPPGRLAARWLHGPRDVLAPLAVAVAAQARAAGWRAVGPLHGDAPTPARYPDAAVGVLLMIDDAGVCPRADLTWLLSNALLHQPCRPARILLLAGDATRWPSLRATLTRRRAYVSTQRAGNDPDEGPEQGSANRPC